MKRKMILIITLFLFCSPNLGFADCKGLAIFSRFSVDDEGVITFYYRNAPLARVELRNCSVDSSSQISLIKDMVCEGDEVLVDGERCTILSLTLAD